MTLKEFNNYRPHRQGIHFMTYGWKNGIGVIQIFGSDTNFLPTDNITQKDIDHEISILDKKIIDDKIHRQKTVFGREIQKKNLMISKGIINSAAYEKELDFLKSNAKDIYTKWIPKKEVNKINKFTEKNQKMFDTKKEVEVLKKVRRNGIEYFQLLHGTMIIQ